MSKLYWKIFIWFWVTMVLIIAATAFFSGYFLKERIIPLRNGTMITTYATAAVMVYENEGPDPDQVAMAPAPKLGETELCAEMADRHRGYRSAR